MGRDETLAQVARQRPALLRWMVRRCGSYAEAQDLVEEVVELAVAADALPSRPAALRAWLLRRCETVIRRARRDWCRQERCLGQRLSLDEAPHAAHDAGLRVGDTIAAPQPRLDEALARRELCRVVLRHLAAWPATDRELLLTPATGEQGRALRERLGLSRFAQRRRVLRLRRRLLAQLDDDTAAEIRELIGTLPRP